MVLVATAGKVSPAYRWPPAAQRHAGALRRLGFALIPSSTGRIYNEVAQFFRHIVILAFYIDNQHIALVSTFGPCSEVAWLQITVRVIA